MLVVLSAGCAHIPFFGKSSHPTESAIESDQESFPVAAEIYVEKGKIINAQRLRQGANVVVIPFKAGVNVAADDRLERVALMIVKGMADVFDGGSEKRFQILTAEKVSDADLVVQGHVTNIQGPSKVRRWIMLKGFKVLRVEGEVVDKQTGETVAVFTDEVKTKTENYKDLGYQIGGNIGSFILSGAE